MEGRDKRILGDLFGLTNFGVNLTTLALKAARLCAIAIHDKMNSFTSYKVTPRCCRTPAKPISAGHVCRLQGGTGDAHCLVNETDEVVLYLEVGDRTPNDEVNYPDEDPQGGVFTTALGCSYIKTARLTRDLHLLLRGRISGLRCSLCSSTGPLLNSNFDRSRRLCSGRYLDLRRN